MTLAFQDWFGPIQREYLETFIKSGGAAVRFVVADEANVGPMSDAITQVAASSGMSVIEIDTAATKLHMLQFVVYAIAARLDWDGLLQARLERLVVEAGYQWPELEHAPSLQSLADYNGVVPALLRITMQKQITRAVWTDAALAQDFRYAAIALLDAQLTGDEDGLRGPVLEWFRGELRGLTLIRSTGIGARIGRHNARAILVSLCHFLQSCNHSGLLILLDLRRLLRERREVAEGITYTPAAVMDCYEVLRQIIDDTEHFEGTVVVALADHRLVNDDVPKRALTSYDALKMRVWDDVRPQGRDNPLSPLVSLTR